MRAIDSAILILAHLKTENVMIFGIDLSDNRTRESKNNRRKP